ncbi:MAG: glycosyltransferase family 4 protein [Aureliella sp.]
MINANRFEGTSRAVLEVAERFAKQGHEVDLLARTVQDVDLESLKWVRIPGIKRPEVADFASYQWLVDRRLAKSDYDIIHSAGPNTSRADVYTIQTVHPVKMRMMELAGAHHAASALRKLSRRVYDYCVVRAEKAAYTASHSRGPRAFLPVSRGTRDELVGTYPNILAPGFDNVFEVPNGADLHRFSPVNRERHRRDVRSEHRLGDQDFVLVFSGGDWIRKGLDVAIRSIAATSNPAIKLLVVGHDRAGAEVMALPEDLGITDRVVFAGFRSDVHRYYAAGDLFLFPTTYEAFSLATIEAAASGLPVLMPDVSGANELLGEGTCGTLIERQPKSIARVVEDYVSHPERLEAHSRNARRLVEERFNWDAIADQTMRVYEQLLGARLDRRVGGVGE